MNANPKLWQIGDELEEIGALIAENGGELTPELEERLDALGGAFEDKAERVALAIQTHKAHADAAKGEKDRLAAIQHSHESAMEGLKGYLLVQMQRQGIQKVETPRARVRTQKNGRPSIRWTRTEDEIPEGYRKVTVAPDVAKVLEEIKAGAGAPEGFAVTFGSHVRVY